MDNLNSEFYSLFSAFVDSELSNVDKGDIHESSAATVITCTYFSGAAETLAKHLNTAEGELQAVLAGVLEDQLKMDASSSHYWRSTCERLCTKYPLLKTVYEQAAMTMVVWLDQPDKTSPGLLSLLGQYKNLGLLELEIGDFPPSNTMSELQRLEFNALYSKNVSSKGRRRQSILLWVLIGIAIVEIAIVGRYYGFW